MNQQAMIDRYTSGERILHWVRGEAPASRISLPGLLLSRNNPAEVRAFKDRLRELSR